MTDFPDMTKPEHRPVLEQIAKDLMCPPDRLFVTEFGGRPSVMKRIVGRYKGEAWGDGYGNVCDVGSDYWNTHAEAALSKTPNHGGTTNGE